MTTTTAMVVVLLSLYVTFLWSCLVAVVLGPPMVVLSLWSWYRGSSSCHLLTPRCSWWWWWWMMALSWWTVAMVVVVVVYLSIYPMMNDGRWWGRYWWCYWSWVS